MVQWNRRDPTGQISGTLLFLEFFQNLISSFFQISTKILNLLFTILNGVLIYISKFYDAGIDFKAKQNFFWLKQIYIKDNLQKCQSTRHILTLQKYCFLDFDYVDTNLLYLTIYKNSKRTCFRRMHPTCELLTDKLQYFVSIELKINHGYNASL